MDTKKIDDMIREDLLKNHGPEIDISRETMSRIEAFENKRSRFRRMLSWGLALFTVFLSMGSLLVFEILFGFYESFFNRAGLNGMTVKLVFQGIFLIFAVTALTMIISQKKAARRLYLLV